MYSLDENCERPRIGVEQRKASEKQEDGQSAYNVNTDEHGKAVSIKYYESVSLPQLSGIQITYFLRPIVLSSGACLPLPYSSTLPHKRRDVRGGGGNTEQNVCFDFGWNSSLSKKSSARYYHIFIQVCR
jgi:hypothetical protein